MRDLFRKAIRWGMSFVSTTKAWSDYMNSYEEDRKKVLLTLSTQIKVSHLVAKWFLISLDLITDLKM